MIKYETLLYQIKISLDVDNPDTVAALQIDGDIKAVVDEFKELLFSTSGLWGHLMGQSTTARDLAIAMNSEGMKRFEPQLVEGEDILELAAAKPAKIPEGSQS